MLENVVCSKNYKITTIANLDSKRLKIWNFFSYKKGCRFVHVKFNIGKIEDVESPIRHQLWLWLVGGDG